MILTIVRRIFEAYGRMDITVQEAIQDLITALIRSLGSNHGKLLTLMRQCPEGARITSAAGLDYLHRARTAKRTAGRPGQSPHKRAGPGRALPYPYHCRDGQIGYYALPPAHCVESQRPAGAQEPSAPGVQLHCYHATADVRQCHFQSSAGPTERAPHTSGAYGSIARFRKGNWCEKRYRRWGLLHCPFFAQFLMGCQIEAIGICFSMTDVFRSEILAVVMQQIMDEPVLPVLFLRTVGSFQVTSSYRSRWHQVIQAVTTYKSLVGFVSTTLLSRLITKKIWTNPPLWEGFIRCAKAIAPASFGALLQLPKDQLRELLDKQPSLKLGLRDYVTKKAPSKARGAGFLDIFGEAEDGPPPTASAEPPAAVL